jgi:hypothetical protein
MAVLVRHQLFLDRLSLTQAAAVVALILPAAQVVLV